MEMRDVVPTLSPSMDIQVSSNLERLLFELYGRDPERTASELARVRRAGLADARRRGRSRRCASCSRRRRSTTRRRSRRCAASTPQRHAARSAHGGRPGRGPGRARARATTPLVALATAHPAKFPEAVERATGISPALPPALADLLERPERTERVAADADAVKRLVERVADGWGPATRRCRRVPWRGAPRTRRPSAPAGAAGPGTRAPGASRRAAPTAQKPAPERMPPAASDAAAHSRRRAGRSWR